jgi:hypothetical protein
MRKCIACGTRTTEVVYLFAGSPPFCLSCYEEHRDEDFNHESYKPEPPPFRVAGWDD